MAASVIGKGGQCRLIGWVDADAANRFLDHLVGRAFSAATVRAYAYDVLNFARFCQERGLGWPRWCRRTCSTGWAGRRRCAAAVGAQVVAMVRTPGRRRRR